MANPRKFSEKIALLNQKQAEETARFEQIMKEVSDVTSRAASASSSVGASPTGANTSKTAAPEAAPSRPLSVKSAGASPPQSSGKHLHINLGNQYRAGSLPNVNANNSSSNNSGNTGQGAKEAGQTLATSAAIHSIDLKTALSNLEEMQQHPMGYRQSSPSSNQERGRSVGVGPMRPRPIEKRHDTSPYSGVPYLSPPLPETWRRTNSDSALHQSANEACQANSSMGHRRGSDAYQRGAHGGSSTDNRESHHHHHHHHGFIERPRSSCEMPRVPGINVYPSSQPPGQQIPIGNNTGSLPDLSNMHYSSPLPTPLDQEDHSSGSQYSNNHLSVPVNHRFLHSCKQGLTLENNASTSQQDVRINYSQQQQQQQQTQVGPHGSPQSQPQNIPGSTSPIVQQSHPGTHSPGHYVYQQPHSPVAPQSPNASQAQVHQQPSPNQFNSLNSYRTSQMVNRPSPQSSPSLTFQGSPLSYSNNPSAPSSPTGHHGPPNLSLDPGDQNVFINQVHADFEQFSMMDSPSTTIGPYINSPSHTGTYTQSDILSVASELGGDGGYFSTSPLQQLQYHTRTPTTTQQLTPQTPNTPTITLTDCSLGPDDLVSSDFSKDFGSSIAATFGQDLFPTDDALAQDLNSLRQEDINALRQGLDPLDLDELQRLANSDMVISDPTTEADFRLEQR